MSQRLLLAHCLTCRSSRHNAVSKLETFRVIVPASPSPPLCVRLLLLRRSPHASILDVSKSNLDPRGDPCLAGEKCLDPSLPETQKRRLLRFATRINNIVSAQVHNSLCANASSHVAIRQMVVLQVQIMYVASFGA